MLRVRRSRASSTAVTKAEIRLHLRQHQQSSIRGRGGIAASSWGRLLVGGEDDNDGDDGGGSVWRTDAGGHHFLPRAADVVLFSDESGRRQINTIARSLAG